VVDGVGSFMKLAWATFMGEGDGELAVLLGESIAFFPFLPFLFFFCWFS